MKITQKMGFEKYLLLALLGLSSPKPGFGEMRDVLQMEMTEKGEFQILCRDRSIEFSKPEELGSNTCRICDPLSQPGSVEMTGERPYRITSLHVSSGRGANPGRYYRSYLYVKPGVTATPAEESGQVAWVGPSSFRLMPTSNQVSSVLCEVVGSTNNIECGVFDFLNFWAYSETNRRGLKLKGTLGNGCFYLKDTDVTSGRYGSSDDLVQTKVFW